MPITCNVIGRHKEPHGLIVEEGIGWYTMFQNMQKHDTTSALLGSNDVPMIEAQGQQKSTSGVLEHTAANHRLPRHTTANQ